MAISHYTARTKPSASKSALAAALLLASLVPALAPTASAGTVSDVVTQFTGDLNDTTISFATCTSTDNTTSITLPYNADVSYGVMDVYSNISGNGSNLTGWVNLDIGANGSVEENVSFSTYASLFLNGTAFNDYLDSQNATSGNVSVPLLFESCPPSGGWDLTFYNLYLYYTWEVASNTSSPVFSGSLSNDTGRSNSQGYLSQYLPNFFSDADNDVLNFSVVKGNASDPGWTNVTLTETFGSLYYNATNNWTGNLTYHVDATDPANQTASSNTANLEIVANRAPEFSGPIANISLGVGQYDWLVWLPSYFSDPDDQFNRSSSLTFTFVKTNASATGWSWVNVSDQSGWLYAESSGTWTGNLTLSVTGTDDGGLSATSNVFNLEIRENSAPELVNNISDIYMDMDTDYSLDPTYYFTEPDRDIMTFSPVKTDPNATGWAYVSIVWQGGFSNNSTNCWGTVLCISHRGNWAGNLSLRVLASDPLGHSTLSNTFKIYVVSWPEFSGLVPSQTVYAGRTNYSAIDLTLFFSDLDGDPLSYYVYATSGGGNATGNGSDNIVFRVNGSALDISAPSPTWTGSELFFIIAADPSFRYVQSNDFRVTVNLLPNFAPVLTRAVPDVYVVRGTTRSNILDLRTYITDPDGDPLTFGIVRTDPLDAAWTYTAVVLSGPRVEVRSFNSTWTGVLSISFYARDPQLHQVSTNEVFVHVVVEDRPPTFVGTISDLSMVAGTTIARAVDGSIYFADPDGFPLTLEVVNQSTSPGWNYVDVAVNGTNISIVSRDDDAWVGSLCFAVRAIDVFDSSVDSNRLCLTVTAPPNVAPSLAQPIPELNVVAGDSGATVLDLASYFTDDRYVHMLAFSVTEGTQPQWATLDLLVSGTDLAAFFTGPTAPGDLTLTITATDPRGATFTTGAVTLHILPPSANVAPTLTGPAFIHLPQGGSATVTFAASDPNGDALRFSATSTAPDVTLSVDAARGWLTVSYGGLNDNLTAVVTLVADDGWGGRASIDVLVSVFAADRLPRVTVHADADRAGVLWVNGTVAPWSQPAGAPPLEVTISLDAASADVVPVVGGAYHFRFPQAVPPGNHTVTVQVTDGYGRAGTGFLRVYIPPPPAPVPPLTGISVGGTILHDVDAGVSLVFVIGADAPLPADVTVTWTVDGVIVGHGQQIELMLEPGDHTIVATVSNGVQERSSTLEVVAHGPSTGCDKCGPGFDAGAAIVVGAVAIGGAVVGLAWWFGRRRGGAA